MTFSRQKLLFWAAIGWTVAIFIACSLPNKGLPDLSSNRDKWSHLAVFAVFGALWVWAGRKVGWVIAVGVAYGILIEIWQGIMPLGRSCDLFDALADGVGVVLGVVVSEQLTTNSEQRTTNSQH
jgi:VanZ family protein